ncbi:hypothetical protein [Methanooceanicella nereidis]|nr:hypothetical protein [Methanocella sp. CWC-04]
MSLTAFARTDQAFEVRSMDVVLGGECHRTSPSQTLFHRQVLQETNKDALVIDYSEDFPLKDSGCSNNIILPNAVQTSDESIAAEQCGFYRANFCYCAFTNIGSICIGGCAAPGQGVSSGQMIGSGIIYPYMIPIRSDMFSMMAAPDVTGPAFDKIEGIVPDRTGINATGSNITGQDAPVFNDTAFAPAVSMDMGSLDVSFKAGNNTTSENKTQPEKPVKPESGKFEVPSPYQKYEKATSEEIAGMNGLERMFRNSHVGSNLYRAGIGTVAGPVWIAPVEDPWVLIKPFNRTIVYKDTLGMTKQGTVLTRKFWDL